MSNSHQVQEILRDAGIGVTPNQRIVLSDDARVTDDTVYTSPTQLAFAVDQHHSITGEMVDVDDLISSLEWE